MKKFTCDKCGKSFNKNQGLNVVSIEIEKDYFFCRNCLKEAGTILANKADRSPEEEFLFQEISDYLDDKPWVN